MSGKDIMQGMEEPDSKDFYTYLKEAQHTDLSEIERTGCVSAGRDLKGNPVIILIPCLGMSAAEKIEASFRKMLLLFIHKANDMVGSSYAVVYAHTGVDIINQYPLIYKFYSVLPRAYKKNLSKMYVIHPNMGLKMFFEFARVFLSHKFYNKLVLLDSILDFQKLIPPTQLNLPLKFLRKEDEIRGLKFYEKMASLKYSFDPSIGTTKLMHVCATYIKAQGGIQQKGLFRLAGDAGEVNLAKVRLQYANQAGDYTDRVVLSENMDYILIGDIGSLQKVRPVTLDRKISGDLHLKSKPGAEGGSAEETLPEEVPTSVVVIRDINTVARLFSMSVGHLPEPLIPMAVYTAMIDVTRRHEQTGYNQTWERAIADSLSHLPFEHLSTLVYIIQFLREVAAASAVNSMDSTNLAIVFAPTICQADMLDPMKAVMEMKLAKVILKELIDRLSILQNAMHMYGDKRRSAELSEKVFIFENPIKESYASALDEDLGAKLNISDVRNITDNFSSRLVSRMNNVTPRGGGSKGRAAPDAETEDGDDIVPRDSTAGLEFFPPAPGDSDYVPKKG